MTTAAAFDRMNRKIRDTFPATCVHTPAVGAPTTGTCVYDYRYEEVAIPGGQPMAGMMHSAWIVLADFAVSPRQGDALTVDGVAYVVQIPQPDGSGGAKLILHLAE